MWLIAEYRPVALFSLKSGLATSTGAKTLLVPTPFAVRTALLDAAIRTQGLARGEAAFAWLKSLDIALRPPERAVVTHLFVKVQKPSRDKSKAMQKTIAFREYAYLEGVLGLAFKGEPDPLDELAGLLRQVNYLGKRGGFFQLYRPPARQESLPDGYCLLEGAYLAQGRINGQGPRTFPLGVAQVLDDWGPGLTFEKLNVYTQARIVMGKDRVQKTVVLPYRLVRASRGFSCYERAPG
jgi:hypothetical protein